VKWWVCVTAAPLLIGAASGPAPVDVVVSDVRSDKGVVRVSVCPASHFLKDCPWFGSVAAKAGGVVVTVRGVPPGRYAVQAFHDEDANGKLDTNWIGIPREGIGFSNDAMPRLMKPRFERAAIDHGAEPQRIAVKLRYFLG
jgi:uncharacterized protein (DUF2141 family)